MIHYPHAIRAHLHKGALYLIRDVYDSTKTARDGFVGCEYALRVSGPFATLAWYPCVEGVEFSTIAPVTTVSELSADDVKAAA
jgi:hypothetical protein